MKQSITLLFLLLLHSIVYGSSSINGKITSHKGKPISGANVMIENSYDGSISNIDGTFSFTTDLTGQQLLVVSFMGYETSYLSFNISENTPINIIMKPSYNNLSSVEITAGSMNASSNNKTAVLTPMDIVTTAGAVGDVFGALQRLPGTSQNTSDGRLFVRGGDARESQIFIDGQRVFQPFLSTVGNTPTRGRYSPFLFKGVNFSTGGYDAEFGQALSAIVNLNSNDVAEKDELNVSVMSVGGGLAGTKAWKKSSLTFNSQYFNLAPYNEVISQRINFTKPFELFSGEAIYRNQFKKGLLKTYLGGTFSEMALFNKNVVFPDGETIENKNTNIYANTTYKGKLGKGWKVRTGAAISYDNTDFRFNDFNTDNEVFDGHLKANFNKRFSNYLQMNIGAEQFLTSNDNSSTISSTWSDGTYRIGNYFIAKLGVRFGYFDAVNEHSIQPRASLAIKASKSSQFSLAYGEFAQLFNANRSLEPLNISSEKATHYVANYTFKQNERMLRAEIFHKQYDDLVRFDGNSSFESTNFTSDGFGKTSGAELFWRDKRSIKNLEYWVTYSYLDNKRFSENFSQEATPSFGAKHNFSVVTKLWVEKWKTQIGASWGTSSGRTFTNPNQTGFLNNKTDWTNALNLNLAYLISPQKILFVSASNVLGGNDVFGYRYANAPDATGTFQRDAIRPPAGQFIFVGFFWTFSEDKSKNMLEQL